MTAAPTSERSAVASIYPLSPLQAGMLVEVLKNPTAGVYIAHTLLGLDGSLDPAALDAAWRDVIDHFPVLRTSFVHKAHDQPLQVVFRSVDFAVSREDVRAMAHERREEHLATLVRGLCERGFELNRPPLMAVHLLRFADDEYRMAWVYHHIILDGWSVPQLLGALNAAYAARARGQRPVLPRSEPFESYVRWLGARDRRQAEHFWRGYLAGFEERLPLPLARASEAGAPGQRYGRAAFALDAELTRRVYDRAREQRVTVNTLVHAAWGLVLGRTTGTRDVVFGSVTSGRPADLDRAESIVGLLINTVPVRLRLDAWVTVAALIASLQRESVEARAYEYAALADVQRWSGVAGALFDTIVAFENFPFEAGAGGGGLPISSVTSAERPHNPLTLACVPGEQLALLFFYDEHHYERATIERLRTALQAALVALVGPPETHVGAIDLLSSSQREQLVSRGSATRREYERDGCLAGVFAEQVKRTPESVALVSGRQRLSYTELERRANRLAWRLIEREVGLGDVVAVRLERSIELVVALIAIVKTGAAYLPIDSEYPAERVEYVLQDSGARLLIARGAAAVAGVDVVDVDTEAGSSREDDPGVRVPAESASYVMYTSGSTGRPKGTIATQRGVLRLVRNTNYLEFDESDVFLQLAPASFDASTLEIWGPLLNGGRLVLAPAGQVSVEELSRLVAVHGVTTLWLTAAYFHLVVREDVQALLGVKRLLAGGDVLMPEAIREVFERVEGCEVINGYGPTENTTFTCCHRMPSRPEMGSVPIGVPVSNTTVYVLDEELTAVGAGVVGELYTGGDGLSQGYLRRAGLTAERYVPDPFGAEDGGRLYRTGDLVRWNEDGALEFVGRRDHQVKVRGFRIELGEIEAVLSRHAGVSEALALVREDAEGKKLVAYYVAREGREALSSGELREHARAFLPAYMVPSHFVGLERFPLTANGKVDRGALPEPTLSGEIGAGALPVTPAERALAQVWEEVLRTSPIGADANFFELGGDSILGMQLASRATKAGYQVGIKDIFLHPTLRELARHAVPVTSPRVTQGPVHGEQTLLPVQRWFFEQGFKTPGHWNQSFLLEAPADLERPELEPLLARLVDRHDVLRLRFKADGAGGVSGHYADGADHFPVEVHDLRACDATQAALRVDALGAAAKASLDLERGPLARAVLFMLPVGRRLLLTIHHLAVDLVSWRTLLEDLEQLHAQQRRGEALALPAKSTSYQQWAERIVAHASSDACRAEAEYWTRPELEAASPLFEDAGDEARDVAGATRVVSFQLSAVRTHELLARVPAAYRTQVEETLLCALARAHEAWTGERRLLVELESHGRSAPFEGVDVVHTVGWFTVLYPVLLGLTGSGPGADLKAVKEQLRQVPHRGLGRGLLQCYSPDGELRARLARQPRPQVQFNYLGQVDRTVRGGAAFPPAEGASGPECSLKEKRVHALEVLARVQDGRLEVSFHYGPARHRDGSIEALVRHFEQALEGLITHCLAPDACGVTPSDFPLARLSGDELDSVVAEVGLERDPRRLAALYPASPLQAGMLVESLKNPEAGIYVTQPVLHLGGRVDPDVLEAAWRDVLAHYSTLRTAFAYRGRHEPLQVVVREVEFALERHDWRGLPHEERGRRIAGLLSDAKRRGFDFNRAPLMSVQWVRTEDDASRMIWTHHHVVLDGWSLPLVLGGLMTAYEARARGREPNLAPTEPYESYARWLQARPNGAAESFWRGCLGDHDGATPLPLARPGAGAPAPGARFGRCEFTLPDALAARLRDRARARRLTLNTLIQAAWGLLLGRCAGTTDVVFGAVTSGRPPELAGAESIVGLLINTVPVRTRWSGHQTLAAFLEQLQRDNLALRAHEHAALSEIQRWSGASEGLFDTIVAFENYPLPVFEGGPDGSRRLRIVEAEGSERPHNALTLACIPAESLRLVYFFDEFYYDHVAIARLHALFTRALAAVADDPQRRVGELELLDPAERGQVVSRGSATRREYERDGCLAGVFAERVKRTPERVALVSGRQRLSYAELERRANRVAWCLIERGVGLGDVVAVRLERSLDLVVALIAIVKTGAAYLPIDSEYPAERVEYVLKDSGARLLIARGGDAVAGVDVLDVDEAWSASGREDDPGVRVPAESASYVMYTSGSTGRPKGTVATQRGVLRLVRNTNYLEFDESDVFLQMAPASFDASTLEIWGPLLNGGRLVLAPAGQVSVEELSRLVAVHGVTTLWLTAAYFHLVVREDVQALSGVQRLLAGGDVLMPDAIREVFERIEGCEVINGYGPTENTTFTCCHRMSAWSEMGSVPIGVPVSNTTVYVLDEELNPVGPGVVGELYTGGDGLSQGYLSRTGLTAEKYVPDPFGAEEGGRLYRTGDLVRWSEGGVLEFVGRRDHQVKVRGFRIELGEIEAVLSRHAGVSEALALVREDAEGKKLVAYYVAREGREALSPGELREHAQALLPAYMVPAHFVGLERFPLTANGKVDRRALPEPGVATDRLTVHAAPVTPAEAALVSVWESVLKTRPIGIHDSFFALGGDSILAIQVASRAAKAGYKVSIKDLFQYPTIHELAQRATPVATATEVAATAVAGAQILLPIQSWFFEQRFRSPHHWNQSVLLDVPAALPASALERLLARLVEQHDVLRLRFVTGPDGARSATYEPGAAGLVFEAHDLSALEPEAAWRRLDEIAQAAKAGLDLGLGPLGRAVAFELAGARRLLLTIHHLVVDLVSWRVLLEDLELLYEQWRRGDALEPPAPTTPYQVWAERLQAYADSENLRAELAYWARAELLRAPALRLGRVAPEGDAAGDARPVSFTLDEARTTRLLDAVVATRGEFSLVEVLLCALLRGYASCSGASRLLLDLEGHGREELFAGVDLARTVGWFTTMYPLLLSTTGGGPGADLRAVRARVRDVPGNGIGHGLLAHLASDPDVRAQLARQPRPQAAFNYLGQMDRPAAATPAFKTASEAAGSDAAPSERRAHDVEITGRLQDRKLTLDFWSPASAHGGAAAAGWARACHDELVALIERDILADPPAPAATVAGESSVILLAALWSYTAPLTYTQLDQWFMYLQTGDPWPVVLEYTLHGDVDVPALEHALDAALRRHESFWARISRRAPVQKIVPARTFRLRRVDHSSLAAEQRGAELDTLRAEHRRIDLSRPPLFKATLVQHDARRFVLLLTFTHLATDRVGLATFLNDVARAYGALRLGDEQLVPAAPKVSELARAERRRFRGEPLARSEAFWRRALAGARSPALPDSLFAPNGEGAGPAVRVLPERQLEALRALCQQHGATVQMGVMALVMMTLHRLSGESDLALKVHVNGRDDVDDPGAVAPLYRELVVRAQIDEPAFERVIGRVRDFTLEALEHRQCPWIMPAAMLETAKWPRGLTWALRWAAAVAGLAARLVFRRAALHPRIFASYLAYVDVPGKRAARRLPDGASGRVVDVAINLVLDKLSDVAGFELDGVRVEVGGGANDAAHGPEWSEKGLEVSLQRDADGQVLMSLTGAGLSRHGQSVVLDALIELWDGAVAAPLTNMGRAVS